MRIDSRPQALASATLALLATLLVLPAHAACPCDCDSDGRVSVAELIRVVSIALGVQALKSCPASALPCASLDDTCVIRVSGLVDCVRVALQATSSPCQGMTGAPTATADSATPTPIPNPTDSGPTPTVTPDEPTLLALQVLAESLRSSGVCDTEVTPGGEESVSQIVRGARLSCDSFTGHEGFVDLERYSSSAEAQEAFAAFAASDDVEMLAEGEAVIRKSTPPCCNDGLTQSWAWRRNCWLASGHSFDDTSYRLAPQPRSVAQAIATAPSAAALFATCQ